MPPLQKNIPAGAGGLSEKYAGPGRRPGLHFSGVLGGSAGPPGAGDWLGPTPQKTSHLKHLMFSPPSPLTPPEWSFSPLFSLSPPYLQHPFTSLL